MIAANHVFINSSFIGFGGAGVSIYGAVNNSVVSANQIEGTSSFALQVAEGFDPSSTSDSNRLVGNNISHHTATNADVYLGTNTSNTFFAGHCDTFIDLGINNRIACGHRHGLSAAAARIAGGASHTPNSQTLDIRGAMLDAMRGRMGR